MPELPRCRLADQPSRRRCHFGAVEGHSSPPIPSQVARATNGAHRGRRDLRRRDPRSSPRRRRRRRWRRPRLASTGRHQRQLAGWSTRCAAGRLYGPPPSDCVRFGAPVRRARQQTPTSRTQSDDRGTSGGEGSFPFTSGAEPFESLYDRRSGLISCWTSSVDLLVQADGRRQGACHDRAHRAREHLGRRRALRPHDARPGPFAD